MACRFICIILLLTMSSLPVLAGSNDLFRGGSFDGHARANLITFSPLSNYHARFRGGPFDGHARHSYISYVLPLASAVRFIGGKYDGHASILMNTFNPPPSWSSRFHGGRYDGHATQPLITFNSFLINARFHGGSYDGHGFGFAGPYLNPLDFDTDGDGLPDWWEVPYFGNLTGAIVGIDQDGDGIITWEEYVADTNPNSSSSAHRLTQIMTTGPVTVAFFSSTNRMYSFEFSTNLAAPAWQPLPDEPSRLGISGPDFFTDPIGTGRFYRVWVTFP